MSNKFLQLKIISHYIDGALVEPSSGVYLDNIDPSTGECYSKIPAGDSVDVDLAVDAAQRAFPQWSQTAAAERSRIMVRLADLIHEHRTALAEAECIDNGKPLSLALQMDIPRAEDNIRFFATAILHWNSEAHIMENRAINYTNRKAIESWLAFLRGICPCICSPGK